MDLDKDEQKTLKITISLIDRIFTLFIRVVIVILLLYLTAIFIAEKYGGMMPAIILVMAIPYIIILIYFFIMRWIYKKFVKPKIQSKAKRIAIIFGMFALYFIQPIITYTYAYYTHHKFFDNVPTQEDVAKWQKAIKLNMYHSGKYKPYDTTFVNRRSDDGKFLIRDNITGDVDSIHITRKVSGDMLGLYFPAILEPSFTKDLGSFNINDLNKLKG